MMGNLVVHQLRSDREVQLEEMRLQDDGAFGQRRQEKRETGGKLALTFMLMGKQGQ